VIRTLLGSLALAAVIATAAAAEPRHVLKDPHYGASLFHFYQEHYFSAVTSLMVSQHFERVAQHADEAEVLRGGLLLSYGLHREAGEIFAALIEKNASPAVRDRAWFYLAKIRYQRGFIAEAEDAVARVGKNLPPELDEERALLAANLLMAKADYTAAAALLNGMADKPGAGPYARFNLGVALMRSGDLARGSALLDVLGRTPVETEEARALRDKANVALGFAALHDRRPADARATLERVRLQGLHSNKALLGFGWAAAELKQHQQALVPWTELTARESSDAAVLEARIAVPYAYAELGAYGQALARYNQAIELFEREAQSLDVSIAAVRQGKLLEGLIAKNPGDEMGWFWNIETLPEMPHPGHLKSVLAQHDFQEAFKNWRDLRFLVKNLAEWEANLGVFGDMLANKRQAYAERLPRFREQARKVGLVALRERRDALVADVARAEAEGDIAAFADARQRDLLERVANARQALQAAGADAESAAARERLRLAAGALTWNLAHDHPARLWETKKALKSVDAALAGAGEREARLAEAERDEPARFDAFGQRIAALGPRIGALIPRVAALSKEQQGQVQELAVAELERQKERLAAYTLQARFAVAQLYDRATVSKNERAD